jgi:ureidoglycolate amidohydrolase
LAIGVVTAIAAPAQADFTVTGEGGHAGAVLMPRRRDALVATAAMVSAIDSIARASKSPDLVATVGKLEVHPGAVNSIPSRVRFTLDLRDIDGTNRDAVLAQIETEVDRIACERGVKVEHRILNADPPAISDEKIVNAAVNAAESLGLSYQKMISRAYHDSLFIARVSPMAMIFIPCRGGVSHRPDEYSSPEAIGAGVQTLALTLASLAG